MQNFNEWKIKNLFHPDTEIYFLENTLIGLRHGNESSSLPGRTVYRVVDNDEKDNTVVLTDKDGNRYKFDQNDLAKALSEDSGATGFQALQYPVGYLLATSSDSLSKLSVYDPRLRDSKFGEKNTNKNTKKNKK